MHVNSFLSLSVARFSHVGVARATEHPSGSSVVVNVVPLRLLSPSSLIHLISVPILDLFHLLGVTAESSAELAPRFEGYRDRVSVTGLHLAHPQKHPVLVGANVEEEPLRVHLDRRALGKLAVTPGATAPDQLLVVSAVVIDQLGQGVAELDETLSRKGNGLPGLHATPGHASRAAKTTGPAVDGLTDPKESPPLVLLQIEVVFAVFPHEEFALQGPSRPTVLSTRRLRDLLRGAGPELGVVLNKIPQVVPKLRSN